MNKLSITLPIGAQICIETEDRDLVREVLQTFMPQLAGSNGEVPVAMPAADPAMPAYTNGHSHENGAAERRPAEPAPVSIPAEPSILPTDTRPSVTVQQVTAAPSAQASPPEALNGAAKDAGPLGTTKPDELEFMAFCHRVNPLGDMRKVVVAAEAAHRHLNISSVDPDELTRLFNLIGWPIPHSFVQTLRNSARTKFRWLERIPGRSGHYKVTNTGRSIVLGENLPAVETAPSQSETGAQD